MALSNSATDEWEGFDIDRTIVIDDYETDVYGIYDLKEDQEISIGDTNLCRIMDGKVRMVSAECPDQICVKTAEISRDGSTIVCLPNRVVLEVVSEVSGEADVDAISS